MVGDDRENGLEFWESSELSNPKGHGQMATNPRINKQMRSSVVCHSDSSSSYRLKALLIHDLGTVIEVTSK